MRDFDEGYVRAILDVQSILRQMRDQYSSKVVSDAQETGAMRAKGAGQGKGEEPLGGVREEHGSEAAQAKLPKKRRIWRPF